MYVGCITASFMTKQIHDNNALPMQIQSETANFEPNNQFKHACPRETASIGCTNGWIEPNLQITVLDVALTTSTETKNICYLLTPDFPILFALHHNQTGVVVVLFHATMVLEHRSISTSFNFTIVGV